MKKCTYCGKEYPDDAVACAVDGQPLQAVTAPPYAPPPAQYYPPRKLLSYIAPVRAGLVVGITYAFFGLVFLPFIVLGVAIGKAPSAPKVPTALIALFAAVFFPTLYGILGFIGGVIGAAIYNLVAKWTGGIEFEVRDVTYPAQYR